MNKRVFLYSLLAIAVLFSIAAITAVSADLDQYNKSNVAWQNGNLGKAGYSEGSVVPFRLSLEGMDPSTAYTLTIGFDITKNGAVGYDFLATYNVTEVGVDLCAAGGGAVSPLCPTLGAAQTAPFVPDAANFPPPRAAGKSIPNAITNSVANGNTNLSAFGAEPNTLVIQAMVKSGDYATTSTGSYVVTFETPATCAIGDCNVLLAWGGHLAQSSYWRLLASNGPNGAGAISGSSYHMYVDGFGHQDRSIQTGVDLSAYLQIYKDLTATTHTDGLFDLLVDNVVKTVAPVGDGGSTPKLLLDFGNSVDPINFLVSEAGSTTTDPDTLLSWYFKNVKCYDRLSWPYFPVPGATTYAATAALTNDSDLSVSITPGQDIYCIITNADYPTAVTLASSSASEFLGKVTLNWATGFEDISTVGFDVFRSDSQDGPQSKVNADLILAKGSGEAYQFFDASVLPGKTYYYFVQLVDGSGSSNLDVLSVDTMHYLKMPLLFK